jgi:trimeric autotransporter adhesin
VWADSAGADLASTGTNQFLARAAGGFWFGSAGAPSFAAGRLINTSTGAYLSTAGAWTNVSDRNLKEGFAAVDRHKLLEVLDGLPITEWSYKAEPGVRHIGPVAQDFHALFGVGADDRTITTLDPAGIALAAIQALHRTTQALEEKVAELHAMKAALAELAARVESLQARIETQR